MTYKPSKLGQTYAGQRCCNERAAVSVPARSCLGTRDPVPSDVTGSGRLPEELDRDVDVGDDERVAKMLRCTWRTIDYKRAMFNYIRQPDVSRNALSFTVEFFLVFLFYRNTALSSRGEVKSHGHGVIVQGHKVTYQQ